MSKIVKVLLVILLLLGLAFGVAFVTARYLVSRLDGTGGVHAPQEHLLQYSSEDGYQFFYPDTYQLSSRTEGNGERQWDVLVLIKKEDAAHVPQNGEGPPTITVGVFTNPEGLTAEQWIKGDARSNYKLSQDGTLTRGSVGGETAFSYQFSGLYENDGVVVAHNGKIFFFTAGWMQTIDPIRQDFSRLLASVEFTT